MIQICSSSEKAKIEAHVRNMENHGKGFQVIFDKGLYDCAEMLLFCGKFTFFALLRERDACTLYGETDFQGA